MLGDPYRTVVVQNRETLVVDIGRGPVVLFVHGFPLSHAQWREQYERLPRTYRLLCPDLPGFGGSAPMHQTYDSHELSMESLADWLSDLLDVMQVDEPITFCGLSMGGYIGWQFWKRHAARLQRIVACNTRASADDEIVRRARRVNAEGVLRHGTRETADQMIPRLFGTPPEDADGLEVWEGKRRQVRETILATGPTSVAAGQLAMAERSNAQPWLSQIELPTLWVGGERDHITPVHEMRDAAALMPQADVLELGEAGHLAPLEQPEAFNRALLRFLRS